MAKENYISLKGQLRGDVKFVTDEYGEIVMAMFPLLVLRRNIYDRAGNLTPKFDRPIISTTDKEMIKQAKRIKHYDIVEIKGTYLTQHSRRSKICPHCGKINVFDTSIQVVNPAYIGVVNDTLKNDTEGTSYLLSCAEISNIAKVIGRVCTPTEDITFGETDKGDVFARYQLAVNRKLYVKDSEGEADHADFPIVYSYGDVARDDAEVLQQNALVYLDGYVHTMQRDQELTCDECGNVFTFKTQYMNLTPYSMEYLRDYKDDVLESTHVNNDSDFSSDDELKKDVDKGE